MGTTSLYHRLLLEGLNESYERYIQSWASFEELGPSEPSSLTWEHFARKDKVESERISVILFASSFLEALINLYLVQNLSKEEFAALEKLSPVEKWTLGPRFMDKNYVLKSGEQPHQDLKELFSRRNSIMHHKPYHEVGGTVIHRGQFPPTGPNEHAMTERMYKLPVRLVEHMIENERVTELFGFVFSSGMDTKQLIETLQKRAKLEQVTAQNPVKR